MSMTLRQRHSSRPSMKHFGHGHPLRGYEVKQEEEIICSGCELDLLGSAYKCTKTTCNFFIHKSCLELPRQLKLQSHPDHPLTLLAAPPYTNERFTCNACGDYGTAFTYHCSLCEYDIHVGCATSYEYLRQEDLGCPQNKPKCSVPAS